MSRFSGALWRYAGSIVSWLLFTFSFTLLYQGSATVMGLGGFCASGGPYVIAVECPDSVVAAVPLSIFGGLIAAGIGLVFAQGFGTPLVSWAWPVLFVGLGIAFLVSGLQGDITYLVIAVFFIVMGAVPLWWELRSSWQRLLVGSTDADDTPLLVREGAKASLTQRRAFPGEARPATGRDWALSLGISIIASGVGVFLGRLVFLGA